MMMFILKKLVSRFFFLSIRLFHFAPSGKPVCTHFVVHFE